MNFAWFIRKYKTLNTENEMRDFIFHNKEVITGVIKHSADITFLYNFINIYIKNKDVKKYFETFIKYGDINEVLPSFYDYMKYKEIHPTFFKGTLFDFKIKYGSTIGKIIYEKKKLNNIYDFDCIKSKYPLLSNREVDEIIKKRKEKTSGNLQTYINRYGNEEGKIRFDDFRGKTGKANTLKGKIDLFGEKDGIKKYKKQNNENAFTSSKKGHISLYGEVKGLSIFNNRNNNRSTSGSNEGLIKTFGREKASEISNQRKVYSDNPIKHIMEHKNISKEEAMVLNYRYITSNFKDTNEEILWLIKQRKIELENRNKVQQASVDSLKILLPLVDILKLYNINTIVGNGETKEKYLKYAYGKRLSYDCCIEELKIIIEYDNPFFHPHINKEGDKNNHPFLNIKKIKTRDNLKDIIAKINNYQIIRIRDNSLDTFKKLKTIILGELKKSQK